MKSKPLRVIVLGQGKRPRAEGVRRQKKATEARKFAEWVAMIAPEDDAARLRGLGKLARQIFLDRNAQGWNRPAMPKRDRLKIKAEVRPHLRNAIHWARKSRDALIDGDMERHEFMRDRARMYHAFSLVEMFQPYANQLGESRAKVAKVSPLGGAATAASAKKKHEELDGLILGRLKCGKPMGELVKEWADHFEVARQTVYNRIDKAKEGLNKK